MRVFFLEMFKCGLSTTTGNENRTIHVWIPQQVGKKIWCMCGSNCVTALKSSIKQPKHSWVLIKSASKSSSALRSSIFVCHASNWAEQNVDDLTQSCAVNTDRTDQIRQHQICVTTILELSSSRVHHLSPEWHHNNSWLTSSYPPYCHCCTWPPGTADGTCARTCQVCPPALAWCLCAAGCLHIPMTWPASPCRWYSPGIANQNASSATVLYMTVYLWHFRLPSRWAQKKITLRCSVCHFCVSFSYLIWQHFNLLCVAPHHILWVFAFVIEQITRQMCWH